MCAQVYLGADRPLPMIPRPHVTPDTVLVPLKPGAPAIWVQPLDPAHNPGPGEPHTEHHMGAPDLGVEALVRKQLHQPYLYYRGSFMDCGCGFGYGTAPPRRPQWSDDRAHESIMWWEAFREATHQLAAYLENVTRDGPVTMLVCWSGHADQAPQRRMEVTPDYFRTPLVRLLPSAGELITVVPG
jgi:hypothetical protein